MPISFCLLKSSTIKKALLTDCIMFLSSAVSVFKFFSFSVSVTPPHGFYNLILSNTILT